MLIVYFQNVKSDTGDLALDQVETIIQIHTLRNSSKSIEIWSVIHLDLWKCVDHTKCQLMDYKCSIWPTTKHLNHLLNEFDTTFEMKVFRPDTDGGSGASMEKNYLNALTLA